MNIKQGKQHHIKNVPLAALNGDEKMSKNDWAQTNTSKKTKTSCTTFDLTRWVWQHSIKDASFTSWAEGAPATGENFKDCALMSIEVVSFMI